VAVSPVLLTLASVGIGLAGTVISTSAQINASNYQAQIARQNQQIMQDNANRAIARSQELQQDQDRKSAYLYGEQVASQSASGLSLGGKSFILSRKSARELGRLDALNVRQAGEIEAHNYLVAANDQGAQATFEQQAQGNDLLSGFINGAGSLVGGAGKLGSEGFFSGGGPAFRPGTWGSAAFA